MTELLYLSDSYTREFDAVVTEVRDGAVLLDRTAFYPGGGGQPNDEGTLSDGACTWRVTRVGKDAGAIVHMLEGDPPPDPGTAVHGALDWERRYRLMRTHTALHVLCGVVFREYGALVTGGNMGPDKARMDFELEDLNPERVARIEALANDRIHAGLPVSWRSLPRAEAFAIPDLIRTKINLLPEGISEVRIVEIAGLDLQADGGTHVRNTREVGGLAVVGTRSKGRINKRLEVVLVDAPGETAIPGGPA
ncbi:MAG TPA: alanyl-tRNA editing protein AlaXM [Thermomicrobiaceae bacterium]|nr:alanyl-tRNA editing protein AlaXM [Thermomicrobiaceae bacterium]